MADTDPADISKIFMSEALAQRQGGHVDRVRGTTPAATSEITASLASVQITAQCRDTCPSHVAAMLPVELVLVPVVAPKENLRMLVESQWLQKTVVKRVEPGHIVVRT